MLSEPSRSAGYYLRDRTEQLVWLSGPDRQTEYPLTFDATVSELIALTGGESLRHGHIDRTAIDEEMQVLICQVFAVYQQYRSRWPQFVQYLQQIIQPRYLTDEELTYCGPRQFWLGRKQISVDLEIMMALAENGVYIENKKTACISTDSDRGDTKKRHCE